MADHRQPRLDPDLILDSQVARALAIVGDRWAFMIIRDVYLGVRRFEALRRRSGAARGTLASRLAKLVGNGILYRNPYQSSPLRHEYRLTDKGLDLYPVVLTMWAWETRWGHGRYLPPELVHRSCGQVMQPLFRCAGCHRDILPEDVEFEPGSRSASVNKMPPRFQRRSRVRDANVADRESFTIFSVVGDRWTSLVIAAAFFGLKRFDDIVSSIGIATNILADRLKLLVDAGVLVRRPYRRRPTRYEYHLSEQGRDLYASTIALHEWADRWLIEDGHSPLLLRHLPCHRPLTGELVCSECEKAVAPSEVSYDAGLRRRAETVSRSAR